VPDQHQPPDGKHTNEAMLTSRAKRILSQEINIPVSVPDVASIVDISDVQNVVLPPESVVETNPIRDFFKEQYLQLRSLKENSPRIFSSERKRVTLWAQIQSSALSNSIRKNIIINRDM
jgi:hypothetical protein